MRSTAFRSVLFVGLVLAPLASDAKPTSTTPKTTTAPSDAVQKDTAGPTPKALAPTDRLKRVNAVLAKLGHAKVTTLGQADQLTPRTPELENGAKLWSAHNITYEGPTDDAKNGAFRLYDKGPTDHSTVKMGWPTKPGQLYAIDCAANVQYYGPNRKTKPAKMLFDVDEVSRVEQTGVGSHVVHAFVAVAPLTEVRMQAIHQDELPDNQFFYWYGCEIIEVG